MKPTKLIFERVRKFPFFTVLIIFVIFGSAASARKHEKPNIIVFLTDDQGWTDTSVPMMKGMKNSCSDFYETPSLQRMAKMVWYFLPVTHLLQHVHPPEPVFNLGKRRRG